MYVVRSVGAFGNVECSCLLAMIIEKWPYLLALIERYVHGGAHHSDNRR